MHSELKPLLDWIHLHPQEAGFITFLIAFFESLALVGLLLPGVVIMTAIGTLIGSGLIPFTSITLWAIAGAVCGDVVSFWIGRHFKEKIPQCWPFSKRPHLLKKGETFFQTHGGKGVFIGRFLGPIRPILPMIAGMMSMPPLRFIVVDVISAIFWAPAYLLPGILLGYASQELPRELATQLIVAIIAVLVVLWFVSWILKTLYARLHNGINSLLARIKHKIFSYPERTHIHILLSDPTKPKSHRQLGMAILWCLVGIFFVLLIYSVKSHELLIVWNQPLYHFLRGLRANGLDQFFVAITFIAEAPVIAFMAIVVGGWLLFHNRRAAKYWIANFILVGGGIEVIKNLLKSPRPTGLFLSPTGWSFPSGHSALSMALFGLLAVFFTEKLSLNARRGVYAVVALIIALIGFSRLYLGAHWLTDVLGGWSLGFLCFAGLTILYRRKLIVPVAAWKLFFVALLTLMISWTVYFYKHYTQDLQNYLPMWSSSTIDKQQWWDQGLNAKPIFRNNRFGKPTQLVNLQWTGDLNDIAEILSKQGWNVLPRPNLLLAIQGLASQKEDQPASMPLLTQLYEDKKPVLVMVKYFPTLRRLLVIRLWDSHIKLNDNSQLWVGVVSYHKPWEANFLKKDKSNHEHQPMVRPLPTDVLSVDLKAFSWRKIQYSSDDVLVESHKENGDTNVLLIKPV